MNDIVMNEINTKAINWFVRMQSTNVSDSERRDHEEWLSRDTLHRTAYDEVQHECSDLDNLKSWARAELSILEESVVLPKEGWRFLPGITAIAGATMAVAAVLIVVPLLSSDGVQEYQTMEGEQRNIGLEDGSRINLNSASSVVVKFTRATREINLLRGEGLFDVAHEPSRPFVVNVGDRKIVAIGTTFNIYYKQNGIDITVLEGRVAVVPEYQSVETAQLETDPEPASTTVLLESNSQVRVNEEGIVSETRIVDAEEVTAWNRGLLILDSTPLWEVAEEISRYVVGDVRAAPEVADYPVTGVIKIRDQETMLRLLSEVVPVTPIRQSTQLTLLFPTVKENEPRSEN